MTKEFHKLLLSELHMAAYEPGNADRETDELICEALTVNENLASLGYTLRPDDVIRLSVSDSLHGFFHHMKSLVPDVAAEPMYPGFPQQVMEMSEAEFRMHQMIHYFSTYGMESLTGIQVSKGWLPATSVQTRDQYDDALLESKVIELIPEQDAPLAALKKLLQRRERLTNPELELALESAGQCAPEELKGLKIRFKENLDLLFPMLMQEADRQTALGTLRGICDHAGDVLRCGGHYLHRKRYHLQTREKKLLVKLLETYPPRNLKENLMLSNQARERNLLFLQYLDYNRFSRSAEHREIVRALRNDELLSWQAVGERLLEERKPEALEYFARRPGYLVRMLNRLLTMCYKEEDILSVLIPAAQSLSGHLILKTARALMKRKEELWGKYQQAIAECREKYWRQGLEPCLNLWPIQREAEFMRDEARNTWLENPEREIHEKAFARMDALRDSLHEKKRELSVKKKILAQIETLRMSDGHYRLIRNANRDWDSDVADALLVKDSDRKLEAEISEAEAEIAALQLQAQELHQVCEQEYRQQTAEMKKRNMPAYEAALKECEDHERVETEKARAAYEQKLAAHRQTVKTLESKMDAELAELEKTYRETLNKGKHDEQIVCILKAVLKEHFRRANTPLKGKKVYFDMDQFDLAHSELETEDRSKDGGYLRSGICFKIPENAKIVRFFVYWNDERRVDVDLHASGVRTDGRELHVGWNADYKNTSVVHSGDITHSDAAEYIDIDLSAPIREINANIHLFSGRNSFRSVETCYVGLMAVRNAGQNVKHYDPKNCFFTHELRQNIRSIKYGRIDVQNRYIRFIGQSDERVVWGNPDTENEGPLFSLEEYLDCLMEGQGARVVHTRAEADIVLTMGKSSAQKGLSLIDHNFFLEC